MADKKPLVFFTSVSDEYFHSFGADKLVKSARYFHPEIPFVVLGTKEVDAINPDVDFNAPDLFLHFMDEYEWVVRFDADSMIVGYLKELLDSINADVEIVGVRNNNDFNMAGRDAPITQHNVGVDVYMNTGLIACRSRRFMEEWREDNLAYGKYLPFVCQTTYNQIARRYSRIIVDMVNTKDKGVYYGTSCLYGSETHWDSWKEIGVVGDGDLELNGKLVKVLHHAGGFKEDKMGFYMFNTETRERLIQIIS